MTWPVASATSPKTHGSRHASLRRTYVVVAERKQKCSNEGMEDDRDGSTEPSLVRPPPHPDDVAHDHPAEIQVTEPDYAAAHVRTLRIDEDAAASKRVDRNPHHDRQHDNLSCEEHGIRK